MLDMAWYNIKIDNLWTRPKPGFEEADRDCWQVGFCCHNGILLAGFYDHLIESPAKLRNMSGQIQDEFWPDLVLALGQGHEFLHGQMGSVEMERHSVSNTFGRWGRDPDDVPEWMMFTERKVTDRWWDALESHDNVMGVNIRALSCLMQDQPSVVLWALDGHIYGGFVSEDEKEIRARIAATEEEMGLRAARYHELVC